MPPSDLPPGFYEWKGNRKPRSEGPFHIKLRCGFVDTRIAYTRDQLVWIHNGGSGDIVAVKPVETGKPKIKDGRQANGAYE